VCLLRGRNWVLIYKTDMLRLKRVKHDCRHFVEGLANLVAL
jgi:hypothetical protein